MSTADREIFRYTERIRTEYTQRAELRDPQFAAEWARLRKLLVAVDEAMMLQNIPELTRAKVIRTVLLGSPDEIEATERIRRREEDIERQLKETRTLPPFDLPTLPKVPWGRGTTGRFW